MSFRYIHKETEIFDKDFLKGKNYGFVRIDSEYSDKDGKLSLTGKWHGESGEKIIFKRYFELPKDDIVPLYGILHSCINEIRKVAWPENEIRDEKFNPLHRRMSFWIYPAIDYEN